MAEVNYGDANETPSLRQDPFRMAKSTSLEKSASANGHDDPRKRNHIETAKLGDKDSRERDDAVKATALATVPEWLGILTISGLIFGGCCSNVYALEAIVSEHPESGHLITFCQFALVALEGWWHHFDRNGRFFLKKNQVPLLVWLWNVMLFFSVNVLNNMAFGYKISVPVHIILRSGGSVTTMLVGWLWGKRYSRNQVLSVIVLTAGVITAAMGDSKSKDSSSSSASTFIQGLLILLVAQTLSAIMGIYIQTTYEKYGSHWRENLFYSHAISLLFFAPLYPQMVRDLDKLLASPAVNLGALVGAEKFLVPRQILNLTVNVLTQYLCIRGVNLLGARASALTITIVLNIRKLVSLLISVWLFGNRLSQGVLLGAVLVFSAGAAYGLESSRLARNWKVKKT